MKTKLILLSGILATLGSCTSAYRMGQTPDDVYYSPAPPAKEVYVTANSQQDKDSYGYNNSGVEDMAIRRGINDPLYRNGVSLSFGYGYNPYDNFGSSLYSPYSSFYSPYNSFYSPYSSFYSPYNYPLVTFSPYNYNYFNSFYSPYNNYYYPSFYYGTKPGNAQSNYRGPRQYNLGVYNTGSTPRGYTPSTSASNATSVPARSFPTQPVTNNRTGVGSFIRRVFTPESNNRTTTTNSSRSNRNNTYTPPERNNSNNNYTPPARTFQPSSSGSNNASSSGNSGGGSAPVRTFRR